LSLLTKICLRLLLSIIDFFAVLKLTINIIKVEKSAVTPQYPSYLQYIIV
jgi:hypothetical protein